MIEFLSVTVNVYVHANLYANAYLNDKHNYLDNYQKHKYIYIKLFWYSTEEEMEIP